jgi:hypothetical protein
LSTQMSGSPEPAGAGVQCCSQTSRQVGDDVVVETDVLTVVGVVVLTVVDTEVLTVVGVVVLTDDDGVDVLGT